MNELDDEHNVGVLTRPAKPALKRPSMYKVVLLNDDFTPMDFVVLVLQRFFNLDGERATKIMLQVHIEGKGVCGVFTYDVAETKVAQVNQYARTQGHPLLSQMEEA